MSIGAFLEQGASLSVRNLSLAFGGLKVLDDVDIDVGNGTVVGIVGPNGSGKTTLLNCISGVYRPTSGAIWIDDQQVAGLPAHRVTALGVGRTFQHVEGPGDMTVIDLAMLGRHCHMRGGLISYGLGLRRREERAHRAIAMEALRFVGLNQLASRRVGDLPYGLAKRADLARVIASGSRVLLLDEPAAGLNEQERLELVDVIGALARQQPTMLLIEHDMAFVSHVCGRLVVLDAGRVMRVGETAATLSDPVVRRVFLGEVVDV